MSEAFDRQMPAKMAAHVFDDLLDYSCTLPTGAYPHKRWKRREPYRCVSDACNEGTCPRDCHRWYMGEYVEIPNDPKNVVIVWTEIERLP